MPGSRHKDQAEWEAHARSHPVRRKILELYERDKQRSLTAKNLLPELQDEETTYSAVAFHVRILKSAELLPDG